MKLTKDEIKQLRWDDHPNFEIVEDGEWDDQGKYQYCYPVVKHIPTGKYYQYCIQRSGSYFTDYEFDYPSLELEEVVQKEVTTVELLWVAV